MAEALLCPNCGEFDWHTIESVVATSGVSILDLTESGNIDMQYEGSTEYHTYTCVALQCRQCSWQVESGEHAKWLEALFPKPDIEGLLALRERLLPK